MASVNHYWIAEQYVGESTKGSAHKTDLELAKAQVHATLAVAATLRDIADVLAGIRDSAQSNAPGTEPK